MIVSPSATGHVTSIDGTREEPSSDATIEGMERTVQDTSGTVEGSPGTGGMNADTREEVGNDATIEDMERTVQDTSGTVEGSPGTGEMNGRLIEYDTFENGQRPVYDDSFDRQEPMEATLSSTEDGRGGDAITLGGSVNIVDDCLFGTQADNEVGASSCMEHNGSISLLHFSESSCDELSPSNTDSLSDASSTEYCPTPMKKQRLSSVDLGNSLFVCQTTQLQSFIDNINDTCLCYTPDCTGKLVPVSLRHIGLGGSVVIQFSCTACSERMLNFTSSVGIEFSKRSVCSLALQVAFVAGGCAHAQYSKILKQYLGLSAVHAGTFNDTIKLLQPVVETMLTDMCSEAKEDMKALDPTVVGSWKRAITSSDGVWLTRGKFSQNCSFTVRNYMENSLLYFVHLSMRGRGGTLYEGTAKGAEGHAASIAFGKAKDEGMHIEVQWQDGDSSAAKSFTQHYPDSQVMLCGGHVARAHTKRLGELAKQKCFSPALQDIYKEKFPDVLTVKCHCPKRHSKNCGCLTKTFLRGARTNFFYCLIQAETNPSAFASRLLVLGKYHARNIHAWNGGQCDFHALRNCSCGKCDSDNVLCMGEDYQSKNPLTCPFHALAYEIECSNRAAQASQIIHTELGRGHSNYPEASHNVLTRFRSKDKYLQNIHYAVSTNLGLLQANMTYMTKKHGLSYHWLLDLFARLKLPEFDGMADALKKANEIRYKSLEKKQTDRAKERRTEWKKARVQEQEERKLWSRRQVIQHTYGSSDDNGSSSDDNDDTSAVHSKGKASSSKLSKCKCGSTQHKYISHRKCPLNKKAQVPVCETSSTDTEKSEDEGNLCTCESLRGTHQRSCPLNPRNISTC